MATSSKQTSETGVDVSSTPVADDLRIINQSLPYHTRLNPPKKVKFVSNKPTRVQESPLDARSPQEVLDYHGMYKDPSIYKENPQKIFADLTSFDDFQTAQNKLAQAKSKFAELPIDVRARFNHDVLAFSNYVQSPNFDPEMVMDQETVVAYREYKKKEKAQQDYEKYKESDEYKAQLRESQLRAQYEKEQYEAWKASKK